MWLAPLSPCGPEKITASCLPKESGRNNCRESWLLMERKPSIARLSPDLCLYLEHCSVFGKLISSGTEHLLLLMCSMEHLSLPLATVQTSLWFAGYLPYCINHLVCSWQPSIFSICKRVAEVQENNFSVNKKVFH